MKGKGPTPRGFKTHITQELIPKWCRNCSSSEVDNGVAGYLRDFVPCYSQITAPLEKIRKTRGSLTKVWTKEHLKSFEDIKPYQIHQHLQWLILIILLLLERM